MRLFNRVLAALLSLALVVGAILLIIEVIGHFTDNDSVVVDWVRAYHWGGRTPWTQGSLRVVCIAVAAIGLILLIAEIKRPRLSRYRVDDDNASAAVDAAYTRRGVAGAMRSAVVDVDGVRSAKVNVTRRRVTVAAQTSARDDESARGLQEPATTAAQQRLDELRLSKTMRLKLTTKPRKR